MYRVFKKKQSFKKIAKTVQDRNTFNRSLDIRKSKVWFMIH